jgi:tetratricopeptide (TPR) repeat protein
MQRRTLLGLLASPLLGQQAATQPAATEHAGHGCTPPPSAGAPSLPAKFLGGMGQVNFPITIGVHAGQKFFEQGVAQLHSFWAREAERSFRMAAQYDPTSPMPWWGVAMSAAGDFRPKFQQEHLDEIFGPQPRTTTRAWEAAQHAAKLAKNNTNLQPIERLYIDSVQGKCNPATANPDAAYIEGLRRILDKYPEEVEAKLFLALALMRGYTQPDKKPRQGTEEANEILRGMLPVAPQHPGLHHYIIHGFEGSSFASDAWASCEIYPRLVPSIPHALHMPGHIYAQTGKLKEAQQSFASCMQLELSYMAADKEYGLGHHGHNVHFLAMAYSMDGQKEKALAMAKHLLSYGDTPADSAKVDVVTGAYRQGFFAALRTIAQHELWDLANDKSFVPAINQPRFVAWRHWLQGLAAVHQAKDLAAARDHARQMDKALGEYLRLTNFSVPEELVVARQELDGHLLWLAGRPHPAIEKLEDASRKEAQLRYTEPTWYPRPIAEVLKRLKAETPSSGA